MKDFSGIDLQELARGISGISAVEQIQKQLLVDRERMLGGIDLAGIGQALNATHELSAVAQMLNQQHQLDRIVRANESMFASCHEMAEIARQHELDKSALLAAMTSSVEAARHAGWLNLPDVLQQYRLADQALASRMVDASSMSWWRDAHLDALNSYAALSDMLDATRIVGHDALSAIESVLSSPIAGLGSISQAWQFLDISGLLRFPRFRILTRAEKRGRVKLLVKENAPPPHV